VKRAPSVRAGARNPRPRARKVIDLGAEDAIRALQDHVGRLTDAIGALAARVGELYDYARQEVAAAPPAERAAARRPLNSKLVMILRVRPDLLAQLAPYACEGHAAFVAECGDCHYAARSAVAGAH